MSRASWDFYFLRVAYAVSTRATCDRLHVGCVIVDRETRALLASGFNGSVRGSAHCDDVGHDLVETMKPDGTLGNNCVRTVHAEANAVAQAAGQGHRINGAVAYVTACPCWKCASLLMNAGIRRMVYARPYKVDDRVALAAKRLNVSIEILEMASPDEELQSLQTRMHELEVLKVEHERLREENADLRKQKRDAASFEAATEHILASHRRGAMHAEFSTELMAVRRRLDPGFAASSADDGASPNASAETVHITPGLRDS